jgi:hypothetical protein
MTYIEIPLNLEIVMIGLLHPYDANLIKNKIILLIKLYIFRTKVNNGIVNFEALKNYLRKSDFRKTHFFQEHNSRKIQYVLESLVTYNGTLINMYIILKYCFQHRILLINSVIFTLILYVFSYGFATFAVNLVSREAID